MVEEDYLSVNGAGCGVACLDPLIGQETFERCDNPVKKTISHE